MVSGKQWWLIFRLLGGEPWCQEKRYFSLVLRSIVNVMQGSIEFKCSKKVCMLSEFAVVQMSSTNRFQNKGGLVIVVSALSSRSSMTIFAIMAETGQGSP